MGNSGGFAAQTAPTVHSSFPGPVVRSSFPGPTMRSSFPTPPQFSGSRFTMNQRGTGIGPANRRPGSDRNFHDRDFRDRDSRFRRSYTPIYSIGLPYAGYSVGYISPDYFNSVFYNDSAYALPQPEPAAEQPNYQPDQYQSPPVEQSEAAPAPAPVYRPAYRPRQASAPAPAPEPGPALTLVFKDGRPNEQIQNYMLTRTTLYVQDQRFRPIPVDQLDLAAMTKINSDTGVEFKLPGSTH